MVRSRLQVYFDILRVIDSGEDKPTKIMYKSNLSWKVMQNLFKTLTNGGFIKEEIQKRNLRYYITEKGKNALSYHLRSLEGLVKDNLQTAVNDIYMR